MTLLLDGTQIRGHRMKLTGSLSIESDDMSGQTSATDTADKGFKPKKLTVAMMIKYKDASDLSALLSMAEATESGGQRKTYRVVNDTAEAFGVRQAQFSDSVSAREDDSLAQWIIQFTLTEKLSNPEKTEQRRAANGTASQAAPGDAVGSASAGEPELSSFEKLLKKADNWLGSTDAAKDSAAGTGT
jgi:hypothetical protein